MLSKVVFVQLSFISSAFFSRNSLILLPLLFMFFISSSLKSFASPASFDENLKFKHITAADGLSQSYVFDIIQDQDGCEYLSEDKNIQISNIHGVGFKLEVSK